MKNPTKTLQLGRTATVIGTLAALLAAPAGVATTIAAVRPPAPGVSLATVTGRDVRDRARLRHPGCSPRPGSHGHDRPAWLRRHGRDAARPLHRARAHRPPARALDVDHVVPLSLAWRTGAARWTAAEREEFANDPANLTTTAAAGNRAKSDDGPGEWLPAIDQCGCVTRFAVVVERYDLTVTEARRDAIEGACR